MMDQLEQQPGGTPGPQASPGGRSRLWWYSLTLAQVQALLLAFELPLKKRCGDQVPRGLQFLNRLESSTA